MVRHRAADFAAGGQLELQVVTTGFEVEEFVSAQCFAGGGDVQTE